LKPAARMDVRGPEHKSRRGVAQSGLAELVGPKTLGVIE
jgi:hypothetical protein